MPYTISHALVAAPLSWFSRGRVPTSSLIVGCMAPDFPYILNLAPTHAPGHTVAGVLTHALPSAFVVSLVWWFWVSAPLLALFGLPQRDSARRTSWSWWVLAAVGILLGAASHALLDATSHHSGWFVQRYYWLAADAFGLPVYKWVQHGGGVIGLLGLLVWYFLALPGRESPRPKTRSVPLGTAVLGGSCVIFIVLANVLHQSSDIRALAVHSATGIMSGAVVGALVYATVIRLRSRWVSAA